tara:strand:+ start:244 stop:684 length:441 start_codon:yes stop_codon:yes gene_type:complete
MGFKMKRSNMAGGIMIDRKPDGHMPDFRAKSAPLQMKDGSYGETADKDIKPKAAPKYGKKAAAPKAMMPTFGEMKDRKKKKEKGGPGGDFVPAYEGADISEAEYKKMKALGIKNEQDYAAYKAAKDKKAWLAKNVKKKTNTTTAKK